MSFTPLKQQQINYFASRNGVDTHLVRNFLMSLSGSATTDFLTANETNTDNKTRNAIIQGIQVAYGQRRMPHESSKGSDKGHKKKQPIRKNKGGDR